MFDEGTDSWRRSVFLVEDDAEVRATLCDLLERAGFRVATAANGRDALDSLRGGPSPSIVILDLMMPVMNGWEFREQQTRTPSSRAYPS